MNWIQRVVACGMACLVTATAGGQTIDGSWTVIAGSDALSKTAAADLREILSREKGVTLAGTGEGQPAIVIGTVEDNPAIAEAHAQKAFAVPEGSPEAYHMVMRDERLFVVGATPKGAMNGVFRLVDRPTLDVTGLDEAKKPVFRHRAGGHRINQSPPADWTDLDQARFQARHFINIVWGEKHGPSLPLEVRQAYGLGLMVEMKFPPFIGNTRDYMDEAKYASAVYYHKGSEGRRVLDPFDPVGREAYLQSYAELLAVNPDTKILYALFGDYSVIPSPESRRVSDGQAYAHTRVETMQEILGIMREALRRAGIEDAEAVAWLWHGFFGEPPGTEEKFMAWCRDNGYGILYNEAGNNDNWLIRRDNFNEAALRTGEDGKSMWGEDCYPLVSVGGACESVNPLIAMPLPYVAAHKLSRLVDAKVNNLVLWWGSAEGWVYSPNLEVLARAVWEPEVLKDPDALMRQIAERDFGKDQAGAMVDYWKAYDAALVTEGALYQPVEKQAAAEEDGLHINDWYQRMGIFTETVFSQEFAKPLTPETLAGHKSAKEGKYWGTHDKTLANYAHVLKGLEEAKEKLVKIHESLTDPAAKRRALDTLQWTELYRTLLTSQHNYLRALRAVHGRADDPVEPSQVIERLRPVIEDELKNIDQMIAVLKELPENANIRQPHLGVVNNAGSTAMEIDSLREKAAAMRMVGMKMENLAKGRPATASSVKAEGGTTFSAEFATDGDFDTRWASIFRDAEWLAVDLGEIRSISVIKLHWKNAYPRDFEIQVSEEESPGEWKTVYQTSRGGGGMSVIMLEQPVKARHVRMKANKQATAWGYSVQEFEVFGE